MIAFGDSTPSHCHVLEYGKLSCVLEYKYTSIVTWEVIHSGVGLQMYEDIILTRSFRVKEFLVENRLKQEIVAGL
jgi:hypothetical protein